MIVRTLPLSFNLNNEITPPVYDDHVLYFKTLKRPYYSAEYPSGIGLLTTANGTCNYYVNKIKNEITHDGIFFITRGSTLSVKSQQTGTAPALLFFNSNLPDLIQHSLSIDNRLLLDEPFCSPPYDFSYLERIHKDDQLHMMILSLIELGRSCSSFAAIKADYLIRNLFENLLKRNQEGFIRSNNIRAAKASTRLEIFKRISTAKDWMDSHYNTGISLEDIAGIASMNSQHFLRMFKQTFHITPHQYLIELKLKKAKGFLDGTNLTIGEICAQIGFESVFSFSLLFKNRFGFSPSQQRKSKLLHFR